MSTSKRIRAARENAGYSSQTAFAKALGWTSSRLSNYEQGLREPGLAALQEISAVTGHTLEWLATGQGPMFVDRDQPVTPHSERGTSPDTAQTQAGQASESERLDDDKLNRAIWFLERQFANFGREFVAAGNGDLIAGVYARIGSGAPDNVIKVSRWLLEEIEKGDRLNVGERRAGKS